MKNKKENASIRSFLETKKEKEGVYTRQKNISIP